MSRQTTKIVLEEVGIEMLAKLFPSHRVLLFNKSKRLVGLGFNAAVIEQEEKGLVTQ